MSRAIKSYGNGITFPRDITDGKTGNSGTPSTGSGSGSGSNTPSNTAAASTLPQTGQLNWPIPVLIVAGVACVVAGIAISLTTRKKNTHTA